MGLQADRVNALPSGVRSMVTQLIAGAAVSGWFPSAASASRQCWRWAAWYRLRPLWALLLVAVPDVRLPAEPGTPLSASYRLHRRVIEIRDAELALRPYQDRRAIGVAAAAARSAGLPRDERDAVIEAVMIVAALHALKVGAGACSGPAAERVLPEPRNSLESEAVRLLQVARAVRHSPIVRQVTPYVRDRDITWSPSHW